MKKLLICLLLSLPVLGISQVVSIDYLMDEPPQLIDRVQTSQLPSGAYLVEMDFAGFELLNPAVFDSLRGKRITGIDLVYTRFRKSHSFSQPALNRNRLEQLMAFQPDIFDNSVIRWRFLEQTGAQNPTEGTHLFHGFVIHTQKHSGNHPKLTREEEISWIKERLGLYDARGCFIGKHSPDADTAAAAAARPAYFIARAKGYLPRSMKKAGKGRVFPRRSLWNRMPISGSLDTIWTRGGSLSRAVAMTGKLTGSVGLDIGDMAAYLSWPADTVVFKVMREDHGWNNVLIAEDVTGSMYPYIAQTMLWRRMKLGTTNANRLVFFNDGDNRNSGRIGNIGGVYTVQSDSAQQVEETVYRAMRNGSGGDAPENNLEGIIKGLQAFPDCASVVMIADNWAPVKDMSLLHKIDKPVHVILCGTANSYIQADYLTIALKTGGSVHTIESSLEDMSALTADEIVKIGSQKYRLKGGRLVLTR